MSRTSKSLVILAAIVCLPGVLVGGVSYANWAAERHANTFCDSIEVGAEISPIVARFEAASGRYDSKKTGKENPFHYGDANGHDFRFAGFMFDKAYCSVALDKSGKVIRKTAYMQYD